MTSRQQEIHAWVSSLLPNTDLNKLQNIQSDASQRKYLRLPLAEKSLVIMDTKPDQEIKNFSKLASILLANKINVPDILEHNFDQGLLLMTDLGSKTYLDELRQGSEDRINSLYLNAIATLIKIQLIDTNVDYQFNSMKRNYIKDKLEVFSTWYLQKHLGMQLEDNILEVITRMQDLFINAFSEVPHVFVHVDYHCRNLMALPANNPGVLDFQDAMLGPITYDLASLFQDAYITWPRTQVEDWIQVYQDMAIEAGIMSSMPTTALIRNFDLVGLQRHIKNLGVFARLHHRDNKSNYLNDMPTLLKYINETCSRYNELHWLLEFIEEEVLG